MDNKTKSFEELEKSIEETWPNGVKHPQYEEHAADLWTMLREVNRLKFKLRMQQHTLSMICDALLFTDSIDKDRQTVLLNALRCVSKDEFPGSLTQDMLKVRKDLRKAGFNLNGVKDET